VLSIIAMEPPARFESRDVRDEKVKVLRAIPPILADEVDLVTVRGQYDAGYIGGKPVPQYRTEQGVAPDSNTETYVAMRLFMASNLYLVVVMVLLVACANYRS